MSTSLEWLHQQSEQMAIDLESLCNINSGSENLAGLQRTANWLVDYFAPLGVEVSQIPLPSHVMLDDAGRAIERATGPALRWDLGPNHSDSPRNHSNSPPRILMTIHYDTVYESSDSFQQCTRISPERMRGPGVIDAKGGIIILRYAAMAASRSLDLSRIGLSIILTPDEEIGSPSSMDLWQRIHHEFDFAMLFEPSMADGAFVSGRKGTGTYVFVVQGQAAHSGRNFSAGRNAIVHASQMISDLHQLNGQRPQVTVNIGRIRGGNAVNVVPDLTVVRVNVRVATPEDQDWLEAQVQRIVQNFHRPEQGFRVSVHGGVQSPPKTVDASVQAWMQRVERVAAGGGVPIHWRESGGASDGNKLQSLGLPNLDTFGPDGDGLHSDQEWIDVTSLPRKAELVYRLLQDLCESP